MEPSGSLRRRDVLLAAATAFVAWGWATYYVPKLRYLPQAFIAGVVATVIAVFWTLLSNVRRREASDTASQTTGAGHVFFIEPRAWPVEKKVFKRRLVYNKKDLYPESKAVSRAVDGLLSLIERNFIKSWYGAISKRTLFTNELDRAIRVAVANILAQIQGLDVVGVGVARIVPLITEHMSEAYIAERAVRGRKLTRNVTESEELDSAIAAKFRNGKLHAAASLAYADTKAVQQQHLRSVMMRLMPKILPADMTTSPAVNVIVKEIVVCAVLVPVLQIVSDPDTWNQLLEGYGRTLLQERKSVRKLRAALDEHAPKTPRVTKTISFPKLSADDNERHFERFIRAIRQCSNLSDARRFRNEVASQIVKEAAIESQDPIYIRRLETGKRLLDQRIAQLGAGASVNSKHKLPLDKQAEPQPRRRSKFESAGLREVLYNATGLSYFMEYMDRQKLMRQVQFWIVVDGFRNPLEDGTEDHGAYSQMNRSWTDSDRIDLAQINDAYLTLPEIHITSEGREDVKAFLKAGAAASDAQHHAARQAVLQTQTAVFEAMQDQHFQNFKMSDLWFKLLASGQANQTVSAAEHNLIRADKMTEEHTLQHSPPVSQPAISIAKPEIRRTAMSSTDLKAGFKIREDSPYRRSLDMPASRQPLFDDDVDSEPLTRSAASLDSDHESAEAIVNTTDNAQVVDALQAALTGIVEETPDRDALLATFGEPEPRALHDMDSLRSSLDIPRSSSPFTNSKKERGKPSIASLGLVGDPARRSFLDEKIFGEEEKFLEDEREHSDADDKGEEDEIHEAAPGDLGLAEAVDALTMDIEKLVTQESIIDSLTKKAELTNNVAELRILRKSKSSIQREINRKELQRQQYIVQESDSSLYRRASISIQQIMVGQEDDGKEFAVYIVEVKREAGEQMPAAMWVVARRYSEFHQLNKRLKARYPSIRGLEFPRRQVMLKLQKDSLQKRRLLLERWLQELLKVPAICRSRELRAFLSQQSLPSTSPSSSQVDSRDFVTRIYNSVTDGMEEFLGNIPVLDQLSVAGQNLISAATTQLNATEPTTMPRSSAVHSNELVATAEAEAELHAFEARELEPFVKPICDLFLEVFELNRENNWLRGRAVVVVLHQLLGGTIERKVRENARQHLSDDTIAHYLATVTDTLFPGGVLRQSNAPRTTADKARSRKEAGIVLASLVPELVGSVVGRQNAQQASRRMLTTINNARLNTHLVFTLLDEVVNIVWGA